MNTDEHSVEYCTKVLEQYLDKEQYYLDFYVFLIKLAPTTREKDIINSIYNDELTFYSYLKNTYKEFTKTDFIENNSYTDDYSTLCYRKLLTKALFDKLNLEDVYIVLYNILFNSTDREQVLKFVIKELGHANKLNFLVSLNVC